MYDRQKQLINDLDSIGIHPFIGYGNPEAKILIVGKECALKEHTEPWIKFYEPNFKQWKESFDGHGFCFRHGETPYDFEHGNFHPIYPFFKQYNKIHRGMDNDGRTSATYFYYQRLIEKIRACNGYTEKSEYVDFFKDCFITELNDACRPDNKNLDSTQRRETEDNIRNRFDWMRKTNFFNQFKVVILACGPYADAIKNDKTLRRNLFGEANVFYCHQLSRWDTSLDTIIPEIRDTLNW